MIHLPHCKNEYFLRYCTDLLWDLATFSRLNSDYFQIKFLQFIWGKWIILRLFYWGVYYVEMCIFWDIAHFCACFKPPGVRAYNKKFVRQWNAFSSFEAKNHHYVCMKVEIQIYLQPFKRHGKIQLDIVSIFERRSSF